MSRCFIISLEIMPGTYLEDAISEAKYVALQLNCAYCKFNFNGKTIFVRPDADIKKIMSMYSENKLDQSIIC